MKIVVYHRLYGCDTGCCGHIVELQDDNGKEVEQSKFQFDHPYGSDDYLEYAKNLIRKTFGEEHIKDLDWENCHICDD